MSIASAITAAQGRVADAYTAISNKGGTLPATQNLANMPAAINSISGLIGETRTEQLDSTSGNTYTPSAGYNGITSITVTPKNYNRTVTAQTVPSTWAVPSGYSGHGNISVNAVTASIDANIQAGNIKSGVTILGVTGTYGGGSSKYGATINSLLGDTNAGGVLQLPSEQTDLVFTGVTDISSYALYYRFNRTNVKSVSFTDLTTVSGYYGNAYAFAFCDSLTLVSLPNLTTVSGDYGCYSMFNFDYNITSVSLPKLKTVSGQYAMGSFLGYCNITTLSLPELEEASGNRSLSSLCSSCSLLETVYFLKLSNVSGQYVFSGAFSATNRLTDIYFNALTTASFGSYINQFNNMFNSLTASTSGAFTIHFPSNLSSTISGLTGYPNFGATAGRLTLAFDLPATS